MNFDYMDYCLGIIVGVGPRNITSSFDPSMAYTEGPTNENLKLRGRPINTEITASFDADPGTKDAG